MLVFISVNKMFSFSFNTSEN